MNDRSAGYEPAGITWLPHPATKIGWVKQLLKSLTLLLGFYLLYLPFKKLDEFTVVHMG